MAKFINIGKYLGLMYTLKGVDGDNIHAVVEYSGAEISNTLSSRLIAKKWALDTIRQLVYRKD